VPGFWSVKGVIDTVWIDMVNGVFFSWRSIEELARKAGRYRFTEEQTSHLRERRRYEQELTTPTIETVWLKGREGEK
jgi:hypothetical protein